MGLGLDWARLPSADAGWSALRPLPATMASITGEPTTWDGEALAGLKADYPDLASLTTDAVTKYNPTPGA